MDFESVNPADIPDGAHLIDVREQQEWDAGHAPNAQHLPASELMARLDELPDDEQNLFIVCRSGGRSRQVVQWLTQNGFDAIDVTGGMDAWFIEDLPMVSEVPGAQPLVL